MAIPSKLKLPIIIGNLIFLAFYLLTSFWNGLTPDDYHFIYNVDHFGGHLSASIWEYNNWSTRWTSVFFNQWLLEYHSSFWMIPLRNVFTFGMLFIASHLLVKKCLSKASNLHISLVISIVLFWSIIDLSSSWFWHCAVFTYSWTCILLIIGISHLFHPNSWRRNLFVGICFLFIGGASAPVAFILLLSLAVGWSFRDKLKLSKSILVFSFAVCLFSFIVLMSGPGNEVRISQLPQPTIWEALWINIKSVIKIYIYHVPLKMLYWLGGFFLVRWIASFYEFKWSLSKKSVILLLISCPIMTFIYHLPISYIMGEIGPSRTFVFISFYHQLVFLLIAIGWKSEKMMGKSAYLYPVLILALVVYYLPVHYQYHLALENRYKLIENYNKTEVLKLPNLPNNGLYKSSEITNDPRHFLNEHLKKSFHKKVDIILLKND